ncbi:cation transport protein (ChaC) [Stappia sp. 22II-S9-Z10]|nr:cation transport protein (ChaC) [Stappia sp. 22II-S9-Z10]
MDGRDDARPAGTGAAQAGSGRANGVGETARGNPFGPDPAAPSDPAPSDPAAPAPPRAAVAHAQEPDAKRAVAEAAEGTMTALPALTLTRDHLARVPAQADADGARPVPLPDDAFYDGVAADILGALPEGAPLWVFAIGSLLWNPRFEVGETRPALVKGWRRAFCLGPTLWRRGNPAAPGRMLSLDRGGECWGVALEMASPNRHAALVALLKTEPPTPPTWVRAETEAGPVDAIAFTADTAYALYSPEPHEDELADILARASGSVGTMAEYVLYTVEELHKAGVYDPYLWRLQEKLAERLAESGD